ncbi:SCP2 sterol-binding domain-containing protein [Robertmurraya sp. FSL W8-0741]|uniref:SCP2 sterol-binding domain-containing protein n=1 Tax=Robertmurraya TaxID=2837507 RepID=UPI000BA7E24B|nr:SCP2 sterol-binding domain-containing protein [Robertmurraya siralis]PAE22480.1 sterol carrier protein [Bacillus sp. 7504-2]
MSVKEELHRLIDKINSNPVHIKHEKDRVFQINLDESGILQMILEQGKIAVVDGEEYEANVILWTSDKQFSKLLKDELSTTMAFMTGSLKVDGNLGLALKLQEIVKKYQS